ncbi:E3 ubiquitin-protein ligase ZNF598 [Condylostylus longicornis]|uniref:E3 ubiquitin-protein ligase ZNF598 n=1 Tax=Condylostylus longicornis TaxID=2530218 RepID=UPI00244E3381|nr:E3 ubiquitin-protein ligase ZNF598 [Condylostylus longicornis]
MSEVIANQVHSEENQADICVVCFKGVDIYSIGECDHPVCYECSTRMRVLCQQNECPICRKSLSKVIFTHKKQKYRELEASNRSEHYNKKYKIAFENSKIQNAFYTLLDHPCPICKCSPFHHFDALKDHVRKEHERFYCDICTEHLKIFTFERKCYNRHDLAMHRRKGDIDNTSHRGHPLCQYCECRFLDRDELFRHMRKEHLFCHFCDADGSNEFYADYESLREHFRNEHYLCEEGDCSRELYTGVFRSDIDLKAHFASVHRKSLNKQQAKHARTLQLEIRLGHRGRSSNQENQPGANLHLRRSDSNDNIENQAPQPARPVVIAPLNEEEFPSLGGSSSNSSSVSLMRPNMANIKKSGPAGLARTKENFPALPMNESVTNKLTNNNHTPASAVLKGSIKSSQNKSGSNGMVIHVSNRPKSSNSKGLANIKDFPALPSHSKHSQIREPEDDLNLGPYNNFNSLVLAKHRALVDNYVSVINPAGNSKIQTIAENSTKPKKNKENNDIQLNSNDFPALSSKPGNNIIQVNWVKTPSQNGLDRKSKIAPAPVLPNKTESTKRREREIVIGDMNDINNKKKNSKGSESRKANESKNLKLLEMKKNLESSSRKLNDNEIIKSTKNVSDNFSNNVTKSLNNDSEKLQVIKPPPGFNSITLNSVAKPTSSLTFTTSLGESYSIIPSNIYTPPPNADARNKELPFHFEQALQTVEAFNEFRKISSEFRQGKYNAAAYFEECQIALKDKFNEIFPELLALLPDISKQQDLYLEYQQYLKKNSKKLQEHQKLEICYICKQILKSFDLDNHINTHQLNSNFPKL